MARGGKMRIPSVAMPVNGGDMVDLARRAGADPLDVDVTFAAATGAFAKHGLRRRYVGGIVIGVSAAHAANIAVSTPEECASQGYDPSVYVLLTAFSSFTGTVRVRML